MPEVDLEPMFKDVENAFNVTYQFDKETLKNWEKDLNEKHYTDPGDSWTTKICCFFLFVVCPLIAVFFLISSLNRDLKEPIPVKTEFLFEKDSIRVFRITKDGKTTYEAISTQVEKSD